MIMKGFKLEKRDPVTGFKRALNPIIFVILAMLFHLYLWLPWDIVLGKFM